MQEVKAEEITNVEYFISLSKFGSAYISKTKQEAMGYSGDNKVFKVVLPIITTTVE